MEQITLNVSSLAPPEPMTEIVLALSNLKNLQYLKVIHRRQPFPLFERLSAGGWGYVCKELSPQCFTIYIYQLSDQERFLALLDSELNRV